MAYEVFSHSFTFNSHAKVYKCEKCENHSSLVSHSHNLGDDFLD